MMSGNTTRKDLILNPYFIAGLAVLLVNDFYLKAAFGNFVTGKLSDFAGLLIFPMFLAAVWPRVGKYASLITAVGFILWKTPAADPVIGLINGLGLLPVSRVVDYSDYVALPILLLSHYLITRREVRAIDPGKLAFIPKVSLLVASFFAFCATSVHRRPDLPGTVAIGKSYTINLPVDSVISNIRKLGYNCDPHEYVYDTYYNASISYYQTDSILIQDKNYTTPDTIVNVKYHLSETESNQTDLYIVNVTLPAGKANIQHWKALKWSHKHYSAWLKENFTDKIKDQ